MSESTLPIQGAAPSEVLLARPELHQANAAAIPPAQPKLLPWWRTLFCRWDEPEFLQLILYRHKRDCEEWESYGGALYRQRDRRTGIYRYHIRCQHGNISVDAAAWETAQTLVFT